jgi:hypothetical protein
LAASDRARRQRRGVPGQEEAAHKQPQAEVVREPVPGRLGWAGLSRPRIGEGESVRGGNEYAGTILRHAVIIAQLVEIAQAGSAARDQRTWSRSRASIWLPYQRNGGKLIAFSRIN